MLGGENRRSKVYASYSDVLRTLPICSLWFRGFKEKNMMRRYIQSLKTAN